MWSWLKISHGSSLYGFRNIYGIKLVPSLGVVSYYIRFVLRNSDTIVTYLRAGIFPAVGLFNG